MQDIEIKLSPFPIDSWFISYEDSYRFGTVQGVIYTPRFFNSVECAEYEKEPKHLEKTVLAITHETLHKWLFKEESEQTSKAFDNIDKDKDNRKYLITDLENW